MRTATGHPVRPRRSPAVVRACKCFISFRASLGRRNSSRVNELTQLLRLSRRNHHRHLNTHSRRERDRQREERGEREERERRGAADITARSRSSTLPPLPVPVLPSSLYLRSLLFFWKNLPLCSPFRALLLFVELRSEAHALCPIPGLFGFRSSPALNRMLLSLSISVGVICFPFLLMKCGKSSEL